MSMVHKRVYTHVALHAKLEAIADCAMHASCFTARQICCSARWMPPLPAGPVSRTHRSALNPFCCIKWGRKGGLILAHACQNYFSSSNTDAAMTDMWRLSFARTAQTRVVSECRQLPIHLHTFACSASASSKAL